MSKQNKNSSSLIAMIMVMVILLLFVINLKQTALAAPFDQQPVPTYSPVVSTDSTTTAIIPANLVTEWRGLYTRPIKSLLRAVTPNSGLTLQDFFASLKGSQPKQPVYTYKFNPSSIYAWTGTIAANVDAQAHDPAMKIEGDRVTEFTPPQTGKTLDRYDSTLKIISSLSQGKTTVDLSVHTTQPNTSLGSLNDLGITELIGRGESKFNGSPANRRWNIRVGVEKMTGVIIKPGEEFSFNKYLGPVEANTGFKPELVIKGDQGTIPEFGGGLCQVSSTTFRAAMQAGLPITQRRNHSYAVQYYAPQGTDATIYPGVIDLKFVNDTGNSILVWPYLKDENYLVFDFYGTYDGRKVELGTPYSYDRKSDGSMKATWTRTVIKNGETKKDTFNSVYQPPALFHKTETFPPSTTPTTPPSTTPTTTPPTGTPSSTNSNTNSSNSNSNSVIDSQQL